MLKLDRALYQNSFFFALGFFLLALWAFWPGYFSRFGDESEIRLHLHGLAMTAWCLLLIAQAFLIRSKKIAAHRTLGKFSYLLFPFLIAATLSLVHSRFEKKIILFDIQLANIALMLNATVLLAIFYGLAMYFRKRPLVHARFMICTVFTMVTPVTDRLIHHHFPALLAYLPTVDDYPMAPAAGFMLADLLMLGLVIWDWRAHRRLDVFPVALALLLLYHASVLYFYDFPFWRSFSEWFLDLPLS